MTYDKRTHAHALTQRGRLIMYDLQVWVWEIELIDYVCRCSETLLMWQLLNWWGLCRYTACLQSLGVGWSTVTAQDVKHAFVLTANSLSRLYTSAVGLSSLLKLEARVFASAHLFYDCVDGVMQSLVCPGFLLGCSSVFSVCTCVQLCTVDSVLKGGQQEFDFIWLFFFPLK